MNTDILEGNKLIAEFMDIPLIDGEHHLGPTDKYPACHPLYNTLPGRYFNYESYFGEGRIPFNLSWDWLMPVVKKCWDIINTFDYDSEEYFHLTEEIFHIDYSLNEFMDADIESVYKRVVEFIEWYNENYST